MMYKGYWIDNTTYKFLTIQYNGDDLYFTSLKEAYEFIDSISK